MFSSENEIRERSNIVKTEAFLLEMARQVRQEREEKFDKLQALGEKELLQQEKQQREVVKRRKQQAREKQQIERQEKLQNPGNSIPDRPINTKNSFLGELFLMKLLNTYLGKIEVACTVTGIIKGLDKRVDLSLISSENTLGLSLEACRMIQS